MMWSGLGASAALLAHALLVRRRLRDRINEARKNYKRLNDSAIQRQHVRDNAVRAAQRATEAPNEGRCSRLARQQVTRVG